VSLLERKLLRDIGRRRGQFIAILATVFLGVVLFGASYDAYNNLTASYAELFRRTNFAALTIEGGDPATVAGAMKAQDGVKSVETRLVADLPFRVNGKSFIGRIIGVPAGETPAVDDVLMQSGDRPAAGDHLGVVVELHMADNFGLSAGDTFGVRTPEGWTTLTVTGVGASSEYVWPARSRQEVFTMPDQFGVAFGAQQLLESLPPQLVSSQVLLTTTGPADDAAVLSRLTDAALAAGASDVYTQAEQPSNATLNEDITGFGEMSILFPLMFLTAAGLATYVLLSRMILAQRQQVGLLLAVGFSRRRPRRRRPRQARTSSSAARRSSPGCRSRRCRRE
jgi:putative ABC transport system permease protein